MLVDDRSSVVSLPELPLLGVLPGTGGLTRVVDKRHVRRDLADYFATKSEGIGGKKAHAWRLVDEVVPRVQWEEKVSERAVAAARASARPAAAGPGIELTSLEKTRTDSQVSYTYVSAELDRERGVAEITVLGPDTDAPFSLPPVGGNQPAAGRNQSAIAQVHELGASFWTLAMTRELDDLILDLRTNETEIGTWVFRTRGDAARVLAYDELLLASREDWLANEIVLYLKRTLKRLDVTSRSLIALIEPGSCFAGSLLEIALAADRSYMLSGVFETADPSTGDGADAEPAAITVGAMNTCVPGGTTPPYPPERERGYVRTNRRATRDRPQLSRRACRSPRCAAG
jgi:benzoyl-CoA-dihydrodiol lyase